MPLAGSLTPNDNFVSERTEFDEASRVVFTVEDDGDVTNTILYDGAHRSIETQDAETNIVKTDPVRR